MAHDGALRIGTVAALLALSACGRQEAPAPKRVTTPPAIPRTASTIVVPIEARLTDVARGLNQAVPVRLWSIDEHRDKCVPAQKVRLFGRERRVTPALGCRLVGEVTRGAMSLSGSGDRLIVTLPVRARISARDIGGMASETATGTAMVRAVVRLDMQRDWTPKARLQIGYDWREPPGVDLLGQRITFTDKADRKLAGVVAKLERTLPAELKRLDVRRQVEQAWGQAFTSILLNRDNPPVWMRVTPQAVGYDGYRVSGGTLRLVATARVLTETFVGQRPADPAKTPLPPLERRPATPGFSFATPVLADYAQIEPVLLRALVKLNARGIDVPRIGRVEATFGKVTMFATEGGRIAVGVDVDAKAPNSPIESARGRVWLTAMPYNEPDSEVVEFRDLSAVTHTDKPQVDILAGLFATPAVLGTISRSLTQNFADDYARVLISAKQAIAAKRLGDIVLAARIDRVTHGRITPTGAGLYLPVQASGTATISYRPR